MTGGKLGASLPYRFAYADGKLTFDLQAARLDLAELVLRLGDSQAPALRLAALQIDTVNASLARGELSLAAIRLAKLGLRTAAANGPTLTVPTILVEGISVHRERGQLSIAGLKLADLGMRLNDAAAPAVSIPALSVDGIDATREPAELVLDSVKLAGGRIAIKRDARGVIDLLGLQSSTVAALESGGPADRAGQLRAGLQRPDVGHAPASGGGQGGSEADAGSNAVDCWRGRQGRRRWPCPQRHRDRRQQSPLRFPPPRQRLRPPP